jgi:hypothetical protein
MATLAELEAQQAQLALAFAQNDKDHVDAIIAVLTDPTTVTLVETLSTHMNALSSTSTVRKSTGELINILTLLPRDVFTPEATRLDRLVNPPIPAPPV